MSDPTPAAGDDLFTDAYASWNPMQATDEPDGRPDSRIVPLIEWLRGQRVVTRQSCSGHPGAYDGHVMFDPVTLPDVLRRVVGHPFSMVRETYYPEPWFELWWHPEHFAAAEQAIRNALTGASIAEHTA